MEKQVIKIKNLDILINETNFPDANFRKWLTEQNYGKTGVIKHCDIANITEIVVVNLLDNSNEAKITSLKGIQYFTALRKLNCSCNKLTTLDVTNNTALRELNCSDNQLTTLDVTNNTTLRKLDCYDNQLTSLNVSGCTALEWLICNNNKLTNLNVTNNTGLTRLECAYNWLKTLNVSGCMALRWLICCNNQLTGLDVTNNTDLITLSCGSNQLYGENLDKFIESLPNKWAEIYIYDSTSETEGNICTKNQVAAIKKKGWTPFIIMKTSVANMNRRKLENTIINGKKMLVKWDAV